MTAEEFISARGGFHFLEIGQAVGVTPIFEPGSTCPTIVVRRVAALKDHSVDTARSAEELSTRVVDLAIVHKGFRL